MFHVAQRESSNNSTFLQTDRLHLNITTVRETQDISTGKILFAKVIAKGQQHYYWRGITLEQWQQYDCNFAMCAVYFSINPLTFRRHRLPVSTAPLSYTWRRVQQITPKVGTSLPGLTTSHPRHQQNLWFCVPWSRLVKWLTWCWLRHITGTLQALGSWDYVQETGTPEEGCEGILNRVQALLELDRN
jgi:hypothetical protein